MNSTDAPDILDEAPPWSVGIPEFKPLDRAEGATTDVAAAREPTPAAQLRAHVPAELDQWIQRLAGANIGAKRFASPDLLGQLRDAVQRTIHTVICNVLDGDHALRLNAALAARHACDIAAAMKMLAGVTGAKAAWIVVDATTPPAWLNPLRAESKHNRLRVVQLRNDYPQSDPTLLLYTLLGRRLKPGRLPTEQGVLLLDAPAAISIAQFLADPATTRRTFVAIHDHAAAKSSYVLAPSGTALGEILTNLGINFDASILRVADPLRDLRVGPEMILGIGELAVHVMPAEAPVNPDPCIRCAWCVEGCPTRIQPAGLLEAAQYRSKQLADRNGITACIECGICSYVCPSQLPLLPSIRKLKAWLAQTSV